MLKLAMNPDKGQSAPSTPRMVFTASEAAQALGVSEKTIYRLVARGLLQRTAGIRHLRIPAKSIFGFCNTTSE
jgi:excisionase family DNA binding protein